ncbi:MAG: type II secretion system F family protein [Planctomycetes bacterium]|nr:type II secretion system F family protein [Planctomycetota bacterium]
MGSNAVPEKIQRKGGGAKPVAVAGSAPLLGTTTKKRVLRGRIKPKVLVQFTVQLATLQGAGLPIVRCLRVLAAQQRPGPFRDAVNSIGDDVEGGDSLSASLGKHPHYFDPLYLNMVKAGEAGGILEQILERLAIFAEKADAIRNKVKGALTYPACVMGFAVIVVVFVMVFVVPKFQEVFVQLDQELPPLTQALLDVAEFMKRFWYLLLGLPLLIWGSHVLLLRVYGYRKFMHRLGLRFPVAGPLVKKTIIARFARTFGTLLGAGVPILEALSIIRDSITHVIVGEALESVHKNIKQGETITQPMAESGVFDDIVVNMVDVGEQSGNLDRMLLKVADAYEREVDDSVGTLFRVIEPMIILFLAVVVGTIVVALFMPILKVMDSLSANH